MAADKNITLFIGNYMTKQSVSIGSSFEQVLWKPRGFNVLNYCYIPKVVGVAKSYQHHTVWVTDYQFVKTLCNSDDVTEENWIAVLQQWAAPADFQFISQEHAPNLKAVRAGEVLYVNKKTQLISKCNGWAYTLHAKKALNCLEFDAESAMQNDCLTEQMELTSNFKPFAQTVPVFIYNEPYYLKCTYSQVCDKCYKTFKSAHSCDATRLLKIEEFTGGIRQREYKRSVNCEISDLDYACIVYYDIECKTVLQDGQKTFKAFLLCFTIVLMPSKQSLDIRTFYKCNLDISGDETIYFYSYSSEPCAEGYVTVANVGEAFVEAMDHLCVRLYELYPDQTTTVVLAGFNNSGFDMFFIMAYLIKKFTVISHGMYNNIFLNSTFEASNGMPVKSFDLYKFTQRSLNDTARGLNVSQTGKAPIHHLDVQNYISALERAGMPEQWTMQHDATCLYINDKYNTHTSGGFYKYIVDYCYLDVELLMRCTHALIEEVSKHAARELIALHICVPKITSLFGYSTLPQLTMTAYAQYCKNIKHPLRVVEDATHDAFIRLAIFGGRVLGGAIGGALERPTCMVDVCSMYPQSMTYGMPSGSIVHVQWDLELHELNQYVRLSNDGEVFDIYDANPFIAHVTLEKVDCEELYTDCAQHASVLGCLLPVHTATQLVWKGSGIVTGVYSCVDIYIALLMGWKLTEATDTFIWEQWTLNYGKYITEVVEQKTLAKQNKNGVMATFYKLMANSTYGKCIQKRFNDPITLLTPTNTISKENTEVSVPVQIGVFILAWSRWINYDLMNKITRCKGLFYYADTDSILTDGCVEPAFKSLFPHYIGTQILPANKLELAAHRYNIDFEACDCGKTQFDYAFCAAKKVYCLVNVGCKCKHIVVKQRAKGCNSNVISLITFINMIFNHSAESSSKFTMKRQFVAPTKGLNLNQYCDVAEAESINIDAQLATYIPEPDAFTPARVCESSSVVAPTRGVNQLLTPSRQQAPASVSNALSSSYLILHNQLKQVCLRIRPTSLTRALRVVLPINAEPCERCGLCLLR